MTSTSETTPPQCPTVLGAQPQTPQTTPVLSVACRVLRSPSRESVATDLSLFSVSSTAASERRALIAAARNELGNRGHSPNPEQSRNRPADIPEILWFEEEAEAIRSCAALSSAAGLQKSFSTSDIGQLPSPEDGHTGAMANRGLRNAVSELALNSLQRAGFFMESVRLDQTSRSCSTWVAVGDIASTSQLPSPHGGHSSSTTHQPASTPPPPAFTAADFIRSVNKKVRQNYIRRRLLTTYKALERLSQSEFNLDRLEIASASVTSAANEASQDNSSIVPSRLTVPGSSPTPSKSPTGTSSTSSNQAVVRSSKQRGGKNLPLTIRDVERERGKPLSKYERNMMIFNWLHTLDDTAFVEGIQ
ncbi:unnamed protein product [Acanthoscelides obtectus]|uniref:Uncharacterized protein n=2 Tax=Acanthoscelides obtectus TaxID=200917 RepID=A0A9P0KQQ3_ACAOB|nr:unnamed protein product [Acanthoscelides obtectus]CAK1631956.1 hypothetical protein AOBTE_LOCUS7254 [Acanthoscelides obtectus]